MPHPLNFLTTANNAYFDLHQIPKIGIKYPSQQVSCFQINNSIGAMRENETRIKRRKSLGGGPFFNFTDVSVL